LTSVVPSVAFSAPPLRARAPAERLAASMLITLPSITNSPEAFRLAAPPTLIFPAAFTDVPSLPPALSQNDFLRLAGERGLECQALRPGAVEPDDVRGAKLQPREERDRFGRTGPVPHEVEPRVQALVERGNAPTVPGLGLREVLVERLLERAILLKILEQPVRPCVVSIRPRGRLDPFVFEHDFEIDSLGEPGLNGGVLRQGDPAQDGDGFGLLGVHGSKVPPATSRQ
jgi:hypothetical protein